MASLLRDRLTKSLLLEIADGLYAPNRPFLARRRVQRLWKVSRVTAESALDNLTQRGLLCHAKNQTHHVTPEAPSKARRQLSQWPAAPLPRQETISSQPRPGSAAHGTTVPLHEHLLKSLLIELASGGYPEGSAFVSRREIARRWKLSRATVDRARSALRARRLLVRKQRRGLLVGPGAIGKSCLLLQSHPFTPLPAPETWNVRSRTLAPQFPERVVRLAAIHDEPSLMPGELLSMAQANDFEKLFKLRYSKRYLVAFLCEARSHHANVRFFFDDGSNENRTSLLMKLEKQAFQGVAVFQKNQFFSRRPLLSALRKRGLPVVTVMDDCEGEADASIDCNEHAAGYQAMNRLLDHGHRNILILDRNISRGSLRRRREGAFACLRDLKLEDEVRIRYRIMTDDRDPAELVEDDFDEPNSRPTALFLTWAACMPRLDPVLAKHRLKIPTDISVVACGASFFRSPRHGPIDLFAKDSMLIGKTAANQLVAMTRGQPVPRTTQLDMPYLNRGTVTTPRNTSLARESPV